MIWIIVSESFIEIKNTLSEKCGGFYCRAFFPKGKSYSFSWLTQSRRIVGRHSLYFHHKTSTLYAMLGRFDCVVFSLSLLRFEHSCAELWSSIFLIEKRRTLLIHLKHDPSVFWLITESSISFLSSSTHFSCPLIITPSVSFSLLALFLIFSICLHR